MEVLVTGAGGRLGRHLVPGLVTAGHTVRAAGRKGPTPLDLATGAGLEAAVAGVDAVMHLASSPFGDPRGVDVEGTRRLVAACRAAGVKHLVYPSIVGIHRIAMPYYRAKLEAEGLIAAGGVPFTTLRTTQFHVFLNETCEALLRWPVTVAPRGVVFQPIDEREVVKELVRSLNMGPVGRAADLGGPEGIELAEACALVQGARWRWVQRSGIPSIGPLAAFREGALCLEPGGRAVGCTFREWLGRTQPT